MGVFEVLVIWLGVSILFSACLGKALSAADRRATAREEWKRVQRRNFLTRANA